VTALRAAAQRLLATGAVAPAIEAHARLLRAAPGDADAWFNLGWLQQQARRPAAALDAYRQAQIGRAHV
jgi:tetratricopeptide (TPR) repeat protein